MILNLDNIGRQTIYTDYDVVTPQNVVEIINNALQIHASNVRDEKFLFDYVSGEQPIKYRSKEIREEINEKIVINMAYRIKNFKVGYEFSNPITYVRGGDIDSVKNKEENKNDDNRLTALNEMMREQSKARLDSELADAFKTCGLGYRLVLVNDNEDDLSFFKMANLNPLTTFVVYKNDAFKEPVLGVTMCQMEDSSWKIGAYSKTNYYEMHFPGMGVLDTTGIVPTVKPWIYGEIPIIEYTNEKDILGRSFGCFEPVISALDELNVINSDRINDISQFVQSLLWFHNCDLDEDKKKAIVDGNGMIVTKAMGDGRDAKITYLTHTLNQEEIQRFVDYLKEEILEIVGVPIFGISSGGSTGSATSMSNGYTEADTRAQTREEEFKKSERRLLRVILKYARHDGIEDKYNIGDLKLSDIEPKFNRNKTYNLSDKVNSWATLIKNGADPLRATEIANFTPDAQQFASDSEDIKKIQKSYYEPVNGKTKTTTDYQNQYSDDLKIDYEKTMQDPSDQKQTSPMDS